MKEKKRKGKKERVREGKKSEGRKERVRKGKKEKQKKWIDILGQENMKEKMSKNE